MFVSSINHVTIYSYSVRTDGQSNKIFPLKLSFYFKKQMLTIGKLLLCRIN